ncbi:cell division protein FtsK, partial [Streptococcus pneumoniae]
MFKIKQTASLSEHYFLNTSKLRSIRWFTIGFLSILSLSSSILFKGWAQQIEPLLIVRENLLFMLRRNSFLFTATKDGAILR